MPRTIGICGVEHGIGTTHIALALSNYLRSKRGLSTAYLELNASHQIGCLSDGKGNGFFRFLKIDFYPETKWDQLPDILGTNYSCVIFDMGTLGTAAYPEFVRCDLKLVVCSIRPWKSGSLSNWLGRHQSLYNICSEDIIFLGNMGIKEDLAVCGRRYQIPMLAVPYLENPFQLTSSDWTFFEKLLKEK
jgi:hypothetical protein